jgi:hypothetical protein
MNLPKTQGIDNEWETIVEVLAEGGGIQLFGLRTAQGWLFSREVIDQTGLLMDEAEIRHRSTVVDSLGKGLALLDRYPWYAMHVKRMHPEFATKIRAAIARRKRAESKRYATLDEI